MTSTAEGDSAAPGTILVLYYAERGPLRSAIADHLYSIRRYSGRPCIYVNLAARRIPSWIDRLGVSLVVFHTILLAQRWQPAVFERVLSRLEPIRNLPAPRIAIPQDEFIQTDLLQRFLTEYKVDHVCSCAAESEWRTIYGDLVDGPTTFSRVLTGNLDPATVRHIEHLAEQERSRPIDVSYRAWRPEAWLGHHGQLKGLIAERFSGESERHGLKADISLNDADTLLGDDWFRFLLRSRWTIGVEGGASLIDRDGSIRARTRTFTEAHPDATYEEVEAACFPGLDGTLDLRAISPRHLEACATRTAQVLVAGAYNGLLTPGVHYLELQPDFSNLEEVVEHMSDEELRRQLADRAYADVVASGAVQYPSFVRDVLGRVPASQRASRGRPSPPLLALERRLDAPSWLWLAARNRLKGAARRALAALGLLGAATRLKTMRSGG